jgi:hypothetical protein
LVGVALIETADPAFLHPLVGFTVPPVPWIIVRKYCVLNVAVYVLLVVGATVCEIAPPSLHFVHTY